MERRLAEAEKLGAECIVLDIDSPGGEIDVMMDLLRMLGEHKDRQTVAYIRHEALSCAAMIALACQRIEMHPDAIMGDVGVIVGAPLTPFEYVPEKLRSPIVTTIRTLADSSGRPAALAEAMVDKDITVYRAQHRQDGRVAYFTNEEWESLGDDHEWEKGTPVFEARENNFLTVNGQRAVELGLAEATTRSLDSTLDSLRAERPVRVLAWNWTDSTIELLNHPGITVILLIVGFAALLFELSSPGLGLGGLLSLLCFSLFFWSRFLGGTAGWLEVTLFLTGLAFVLAEVFLLPGFGVAGITGAGLLVTSLVMASRRVWVPESAADWGDLGWGVLTVCGALATVLVLAFFAADHFGQMPFFKKLVLQPPTAHAGVGLLQEGQKKGVEQAPWERVSVGDLGVSLSALRPGGKAQFGEDVLDVSTEGEFIDADQPIRVYRKQGIRLIVRQA
jgi:membrane-bound serine protease (ClpP class)